MAESISVQELQKILRVGIDIGKSYHTGEINGTSMIFMRFNQFLIGGVSAFLEDFYVFGDG
jgi:hypothetical protein